jgi:amidase/aspartyl-tRNA(Asn)/glutamyl-tRNA(Gln) amidotransferase subunit A
MTQAATTGALDALAIAAAVREGSTTAVAAAEAALAAIARVDPALNSFTAVTGARALAEAAAIDRRRAAGQRLPALAGVPYAVKNLFDIEGLPTLAGSLINADRPAAGADATLVRRMRDAGAVLVGALNMDEFAYGFTTENSHYGAVHNPHDVARTAGGSSGGCGAAVAARLVPLALGSDTNGSIRVPSSLCGIWGLKPTFGRLPRTGSFPFVASLDHLGPFATTLADLAVCYDAIQGYDAGDPGCAQRGVEPMGPATLPRIEGLRVARLSGYFDAWTTPAARTVVDTACAALSVKRSVELPAADLGRAAAFLISGCEGGALHLPNLRARRESMEPLSRDRFLAGALLPAAWYVQAQRVRAWYRDQVRSLFTDVDVLIAAATPCAATPLGAEWLELNGQQLPLRPSMGLLTQPLSCIGLPVIAAPVAQPAGLPIGVQIIAAPWREDLCFRVAAVLEAQGVAVSLLPPVHA